MKIVIICAATFVAVNISIFLFVPDVGGERPRLLRAWIIQSLTAPVVERDVRQNIKQEVIHYLEQQKTRDRAGTANVFVAFDFYGASKKWGLIKVYGWIYTLEFKLIDNQIIGGRGHSGPILVLLNNTKEGVKGIGSEESIKTRDYIEIFPKSLWHKIFRSIKEADSIFEIMDKWRKPIPPGTKYELHEYPLQEMQDRVVAFYCDKMSDERFFRKQKPRSIIDSHKHKHNIYNQYNLKAPYERIIVKANPGKIIRDGGDDPVISPDGRFNAWVGVGHRNYLYFEDNPSGPRRASVGI